MAKRAYAVYEGFGTGLAAGTGKNVMLKDGITPFCQKLIKAAPSQMVRAAQRVAYTMMKEIQQGIARGNLAGISIPDRKKLDAAATSRLLLANHRLKKSLDTRQLMRHLRQTRRFMGDSGIMGSRGLMGAVKYAKQFNGAVVGWASKRSPYWGAAVQEARRGSRFNMQHTGSQTVTKKMKRYFAMLGMPTKKTIINQPKADILAPYFRGRTQSNWLAYEMNKHLQRYINQEARSRAYAA